MPYPCWCLLACCICTDNAQICDMGFLEASSTDLCLLAATASLAIHQEETRHLIDKALSIDSIVSHS